MLSYMEEVVYITTKRTHAQEIAELWLSDAALDF